MVNTKKVHPKIESKTKKVKKSNVKTKSSINNVNNVNNVIAQDLCNISIELGKQLDIDAEKIINIMDEYFIKKYDTDLKIKKSFKDSFTPMKPAPKKSIKKNIKKVSPLSGKTSPPFGLSGGKCLFKTKNGMECLIKPKEKQLFCAKHNNTKFAANYFASLPDPDLKPPGHGPSIVRDKTLKEWVIDGTNLIIYSPNKKVLKGCILQGQVKKANKNAIKQALEMGVKLN